MIKTLHENILLYYFILKSENKSFNSYRAKIQVYQNMKKKKKNLNHIYNKNIQSKAFDNHDNLKDTIYVEFLI